MYYPRSENKGADQLRGYCEADLRLCFRICRLLVFPWGGSYVNWNFDDAKTKAQISCAVTEQLICAFVLATGIVHFLFYLYPKYQDSCFLLWVYRPVYVGPGRKSRRPVYRIVAPR